MAPRSQLIQKYYPTLHIGLTAMVMRGRREVYLHCRQSDLDGACGLHSAVSALVLMNKIANPFVLSERRKGVAAKLWHIARDKYRDAYFYGATAAELSSMLDALDAGLHIDYVTGAHSRCLDFTLQHLSEGRLAITSWQSERSHHWILAVGVEGLQCGRHFTPHALLCIDPGTPNEPILTGCNGRLQFKRQAKQTAPMRYLSADGTSTPVRLTSAVAIGEMK